jgi:hypothetical protein
VSGLRKGWSRVAADQIKHSSNRVRILKVTFRASGGGSIYIVSVMDKYKGGPGQDVWVRHASTPQDLDDAYEIAEKFITTIGK